MENNANLLLEVWDLLKDYVHVKEKEDSAIRLIQIFEGYGLGPNDLMDIRGEDKDIDHALDIVYPDSDEEYKDED
jgi:hypothetical protein